MVTEKFNTRIGAVAAAAGSAVGLGNVWRFPYIAGEDGGAVFLILYVLLTIVIGIPVLLTELSLGRMSGQPVTSTFQTLHPKSKWYLIGLGGMVTAFLVASFYNVVSGWTIYYSVESISGSLNGMTEEGFSQFFNDLHSDSLRCIIWMAVAMGLTAFIVGRGVSSGIEKYSKILMPMLFLLLIVVLIRAVTLEGSSAGLKFFLSPDFSKLSAKTFFDALGQAFFSLSVGMGCMCTYGSYIKKTENLPLLSARVASIDFLCAFLSGAVIFTCVFAFGINPGEGPGLVFISLPNVFSQMAMGQIFQSLFFILLVVAAITSSVSVFEVIVAYLTTSFKLGRQRAAFYSSLLILVCGILCSVYPIVFDTFSFLSSSILMPLGAFLIIVFSTRILPKEALKAELESHGKSFALFPVFYFIVKYIVPIAIIIIFLQGIPSWLGINL